MRIITGTARGRKLVAPEGLDVRPTTEITKEAVFSALHFALPGAKFIDIFSGTGQMGLEAVSRGAASATFVENGKASLQALRENIHHCGFDEQCRVFAMDAKSFLQNTAEVYDIAFLDPPYQAGVLAEVLTLLAGHMAPDGIIVCETDKQTPMPERAGDFTMLKTRRYGKTMIYTYTRPDTDEEAGQQTESEQA